MNWHQLSIDRVFEAMGSSARGLAPQLAAERLIRYGPNELPVKGKLPAWKLFLRQFKDFMILVLMAAAMVAGISGEISDALVIVAIILLNAVIGFFQEYKAEKAMEALKKLDKINTTVIRNGNARLVFAVELVPGDIVLLETGNIVPADLRLFETHALKLQEASLTGESFPVDKHPKPCPLADTPLGDRVNMAYKGTIVIHGRGAGVVVATGITTELGRISTLLGEPEKDTPLQKRMAGFSRKLSYIILVVCTLLFAIGLLRGEPVMNMLLLTISLAVAAIPEALPALITVALAIGAKRMIKKNVLIRKLSAVETLGSVTVICTDKTGTITQNKMKVMELVHAGNVVELDKDIPALLLLMTLNQDLVKTGDTWTGDPTEMALLEYVQQHHPTHFAAVLHRYPRVAEIPFDAERKCMTTLHRSGERILLVSKGATETITSRLHTDGSNAAIASDTNRLAASGMRVMAYGYRFLDELPLKLDYTIEKELIFCGLTAMIDPARENVKQAISECKGAGIMPVMITGDHPETAAAIARETGILEHGDLVLSGTALSKYAPEELDKIIDKVKVYARVSPEQKLSIVKSLQRMNHYVAMTGDGINDAPSLKTANIGIAMGITGTDVSKEAAHMILLDDNFSSIVNGIREGRRVYANIRKFVRYILTCNSAEICIIFFAPLLGLPIPLLPIQLLWINLVTDGLPGLALSVEKADKNIMRKLPVKAGADLFSGGTGIHIIWAGLLLTLLMLGAQAITFYSGNEHSQTIIFTALSVSQLAHVFACRSESELVYSKGIFSNRPLVIVITVTVFLQLLVIYLPIGNRLFKTVPLSWKECLCCFAIAVFFFHLVELGKWLTGKYAERFSQR